MPRVAIIGAKHQSREAVHGFVKLDHKMSKAMPNQISVILRKLEDVRLMKRLRDYDPASREKLLKEIGTFRAAILRGLFWSWDHVDLISYEQKLKEEYYKIMNISELTSIINPEK